MGLVHLWVSCWIFSWWCKVLMKLRSLDKQPILSSRLVTRRCVGITRRRSPFCFVASLGIIFSFVGCPNFLLPFISFETTELWFQSAMLRLVESGRKYIPHTTIIPARPVGSDKANYITERPSPIRLVRDIIFLLLRPPPTRCIITSSGIDGTEAPSQHFLSIKVNEVDH
jgi:hypothetical protein